MGKNISSQDYFFCQWCLFNLGLIWSTKGATGNGPFFGTIIFNAHTLYQKFNSTVKFSPYLSNIKKKVLRLRLFWQEKLKKEDTYYATSGHVQQCVLPKTYASERGEIFSFTLILKLDKLGYNRNQWRGGLG